MSISQHFIIQNVVNSLYDDTDQATELLPLYFHKLQNKRNYVENFTKYFQVCLCYECKNGFLVKKVYCNFRFLFGDILKIFSRKII